MRTQRGPDRQASARRRGTCCALSLGTIFDCNLSKSELFKETGHKGMSGKALGRADWTFLSCLPGVAEFRVCGDLGVGPESSGSA